MTTSRLYVFAPLAGEPRLAGAIDWADGTGTFRYAKSWPQQSGAYALDPRNLPLDDAPHSTRLNGGIPGVLADAGPDAWGKRLLEIQRGQVPATPLDILRVTNGAGTGALLFSQSRERPAPARTLVPTATLAQLENAARHVDAGDAVDQQVFAQIFASGSSLGGARPKANIELDGMTWIAKFARANDNIDVPRVEWACLSLARAAGIDVPDHRLAEVNGRAVLLVRRFDRDGENALHYLSLHALLSAERLSAADVTAPEGTCTYGGLAALCRQIGVQDAGRSMFQRMVMNIAIGNTDDHLRNHGLLHDANGWRMAPAFDLTAIGGNQQAVGVGTQGRTATRDNALTDLPRFGLDLAEAQAIMARVDHALQNASATLKEAGLPPQDIDRVMKRMRNHDMNEDEDEASSAPRP